MTPDPFLSQLSGGMDRSLMYKFRDLAPLSSQLSDSSSWTSDFQKSVRDLEEDDNGGGGSGSGGSPPGDPPSYLGEEKVSGTNGTVEEYQQSDERAEVLLTRDQFFGILVVVW